VTRTDKGYWQQQSGPPSDPQPGNIPGVSATSPQRKLQQRHAGHVRGRQRLLGCHRRRAPVGAGSLGQDAAAVFYLDDYKPIYFEITAQIMTQKPTGGWKRTPTSSSTTSSPTDFKFAGIDVSLEQARHRPRDASGWHVDVAGSVPDRSRPTRGTTCSSGQRDDVTSVDGQARFTYTFAAQDAERRAVP
jgi:hypothetical protein